MCASQCLHRKTYIRQPAVQVFTPPLQYSVRQISLPPAILLFPRLTCHRWGEPHELYLPSIRSQCGTKHAATFPPWHKRYLRRGEPSASWGACFCHAGAPATFCQVPVEHRSRKAPCHMGASLHVDLPCSRRPRDTFHARLWPSATRTWRHLR